jgi:hypothetical protein
VIEVEHRALSALQHHVAAVRERVMQQLAGVRDVGPKALRVDEVVLDDLLGLHRQLVVDLRQEVVLLPQDHVELLAKDLLVVQVLHADADPCGAVGVGGTDPALGRAERVLPEEPLRHLLELEVVRHDQVRVQRQPETADVEAGRGELIQLAEQHRRVDDDAVRDHVGDVREQHARRHEVELELAALGDDRVAGVVTALVPDHEVHPVRQVVDRLALAFITPLGAEHDRGGHRGLDSRATLPPAPARVENLSRTRNAG